MRLLIIRDLYIDSRRKCPESLCNCLIINGGSGKEIPGQAGNDERKAGQDPSAGQAPRRRSSRAEAEVLSKQEETARSARS